MYEQKLPWVVNYDENEIPPYELPSLLTCQDGTVVKTAEEWNSKRKKELHQLFRDIMYGNPLPMPDKVRYTVISEKKDARNGLATRREVRIDFLMNNSLRHSVIVLMYIPNERKGKVPVCVSLTFGGNQGITDEDDVFMTGLTGKRHISFIPPHAHTRRYPIDYIMKRGYALAVASYHDFFPDFREHLGNCQFHDCTHRQEPGCGIRQAVEEGKIEKSRYESYLRLYEKASQVKLWELK